MYHLGYYQSSCFKINVFAGVLLTKRKGRWEVFLVPENTGEAKGLPQDKNREVKKTKAKCYFRLHFVKWYYKAVVISLDVSTPGVAQTFLWGSGTPWVSKELTPSYSNSIYSFLNLTTCRTSLRSPRVPSPISHNNHFSPTLWEKRVQSHTMVLCSAM